MSQWLGETVAHFNFWLSLSPSQSSIWVQSEVKKSRSDFAEQRAKSLQSLDLAICSAKAKLKVKVAQWLGDGNCCDGFVLWMC